MFVEGVVKQFGGGVKEDQGNEGVGRDKRRGEDV